jgi:hypothetical protein
LNCLVAALLSYSQIRHAAKARSISFDAIGVPHITVALSGFASAASQSTVMEVAVGDQLRPRILE